VVFVPFYVEGNAANIMGTDHAKSEEQRAVCTCAVNGLHGHYVERDYFVYVCWTYGLCNNESTVRSGGANICKHMNVAVTETIPISSFLLHMFLSRFV
jgi:hypothetical protein